MSSEIKVGRCDSQTLSQIAKSMPKVELHAHLNGSITQGMLRHLKSHFKGTDNAPPSEEPSDDGSLEGDKDQQPDQAEAPSSQIVEKPSLAQYDFNPIFKIFFKLGWKGIDISGDPNFGTFKWICPLLQEARKLGFKISCHLPEVVNVEETEKFLEFRPDRIAHGQFLHPSSHGTQRLWKLAKTSAIPIEACITSNLISGVTPSIHQHYVKYLHQENIPYTICTDDCGVFETCLSSEYNKLLEIVPLSKKELKDLCIQSVSFAFACQAEKDVLSQRISQWWEEEAKI